MQISLLVSLLAQIAFLIVMFFIFATFANRVFWRIISHGSMVRYSPDWKPTKSDELWRTKIWPTIDVIITLIGLIGSILGILSFFGYGVHFH
jgi:hypothetical protein